MHIEIFKLKFVNVKNNFLHFAPTPYSNLAITSVRALKADVQDGSTFYFSPYHSPYGGTLDDDCVGISAIYARALGLEEDQHLAIYTINNIGSIKRLHVSPWTANDLEIVCSASAVLESQLLSQLRVVWPKQVFCAWVSNNISVNLVVDSLSPELQFGRLEEYTEIVVDFEPAEKTECDPKPNESQIPRYLRKFLTSKDQDPVEATYVRCIPLTDSIKKLYKLDRIPPFAVYANKTEALSSNDPSNLWKLVRTTDNGLLEVYVQLFFLENSSSRKESRRKQLFVSDSVKSHLSLQLGVEAEILPVKDVYPHESINAILISPRFPFKNSPEEESRLVDEVRDTLMDHALFHASVLLNNKGEVTLMSGKTVQLILRPLSLVWSFLSNASVRDISLSCNEFNPDPPIQTHQPRYKPNLWDVIIDSNETLRGKFNFNDTTVAHLQTNVLIIGRRGSGKTELSKTILNRFSGHPTFYHQSRIEFMKLKGKRIEVVVRELNEALKDAVDHQPSVLLLEDIDVVANLPSTDHAATEALLHTNKVVHKVVEIIEECQRINYVSVIGTSSTTNSIHPRIYSDRGKSLFSTCALIPEYSKGRRKDLLSLMIANKAPASNIDELELDHLANVTEGFLMADLVKLVKVALFKAWQRRVTEGVNLEITRIDLEDALSTTKPSYLEGINLLKEKKHSWSSVGGLDSAKSKIVEVILWPTKYPHIMSQCPLKPQTGILIYGAPGTGKTILARAAAKESSLNFITVKGPELMSKYIGQSEEGVRNVFEKAQAAKPCLLFFDEFESLAPRRGKDQTGVTDRVVNQLLTALDGVDPLLGVFVMAATSRPDLVDPALLRPGRIGTAVLCPFPNLDDRVEILSALSSEIELDDDVNFSELAQVTDGFSGADLKGLLSAAQLKVIDNIVLENSVDGKELEVVLSAELDHHAIKLKQEHLLDVLRDCKPSLSPVEKEKYKRIYEDFMKPSFVDVSSQKVTLA